MLSAMKDKIGDSQVAHQIQFYSNVGPRIPFLFFCIVIGVSILSAPLWGMYVKRERDKWWRAEIASKSSAVRGVIAKGSAEAEATDEDILKALGEDYAKLNAEVVRLKNSNQPQVGCAPVPASCLRLRDN